jgi:hypothetical protein
LPPAITAELRFGSSNVHKNSNIRQITIDLIFPVGLKIFLIKRAVPLKNRMVMVFVSNIKYIDQKSDVNVEKNNNMNYGILLIPNILDLSME